MNRAILSGGFRPFFLLGSLYGPAIILLWSLQRAGLLATPAGASLHAHELIFGFCVAIVCGVLLTALPSWSGTRELRGWPLALLALLWLAGRVAFHLAAVLPPWLVLLLDGALLPVLILMIAPGLLQARPRLFFWTLPPLLALALGNLGFSLAQTGVAAPDPDWCLRLGLYGLAFLYSLYGGLLTPAFTRNYLRARGEESRAILVPLEYATALAMFVFAAADLSGLRGIALAALALPLLLLQCWRCLRWRGWRTHGEPLLWVLHYGYAWFIVALLMRAASELLPEMPREAWIHAFTLGALGPMMGGLLVRVTLRHTGRPPRLSAAMRLALWLLVLAPLLRLIQPWAPLPAAWLAAAAGLWAGAFLIYLACHARFLLTPGQPGSAAAAWGSRPILSE